MQKDEQLGVVEDGVEVLAIRRAPEVVLEEARRAARALKDVIDAKPRKVMFNGEQYLEYEDWQTCARFYGITAKVVETQFVEYGGVRGFSAKAVALRSDGMEISAAEAECLNDEEKWNLRPKYEWRDGPTGRDKIKVGEEPVPLFQLKSMAQTRACAKTLRNVLSWVVVLAGYRPTPAEEMTGQERGLQPSVSGAADSDGSATTTTGVRADGMTYVTEVREKRGVNGARPWVKATVLFTDGRSGGTFDTDLGAKAKQFQADHAPCVPELTEAGKYGADLVRLEAWTDPGPALPFEEDTEPAGQPEKILTVRKQHSAAGDVDYFLVQTDRRQYATLSVDHANAILALRAAGEFIVVQFDRATKLPPPAPVAWITAFLAATQVAPPGDLAPAVADSGSSR